MAALLTVVWSLAGWRQHTQAAAERTVTDDAVAAEAVQYLAATLANAIADLRFLATSNEVRELLADPHEPQLATTATEFISILRQKPLYRRLRIFDSQGMELLRIERHGRSLDRSPQSGLESKARRDFFEEAQKLEPGSVYVSRFDLDVQGGQIVQPPTPMLRLSTPVRLEGRSAMVITLNLDGDQLIEAMHRILDKRGRQGTLIDDQGYWLYHPNPAMRWGGQIGTEEKLARRDPELWQRMQASAGNAGVRQNTYFHPLLPLRGVADLRGALVDLGWWITLDHHDEVSAWYHILLTPPFWASQLLLLIAAFFVLRLQREAAERRSQAENESAAFARAERELREVRGQVYELSLRMQSAKDLESFTELTLSELAPVLGAALGAFYCIEDGWLQPIGSYGLAKELMLRQFRLGDSLLGEALRQHRGIELAELPPNYLMVRTGTGRSAPPHLLILPLWVKDENLGAIEFALNTPPSEQQRLMLRQALPLISLHLANYQHRRKVGST
ncbi:MULTISPECIES: GAF domain-containing protein [Hydrocarboniphaga]|jgi:hypothetical protein|uniref:Uncharacterized protein n=2 Tax=Hydrocarboniphaga effusa TaxID=243629 RepID=I8T9A4_9GAMM|nr:GAF domain-containing protein [Hydrocarboniphaga sp.]EIT70368.1 hypothetical protein WQQ_05050 [Hydrocarboniphaga effusa AP103]MDZ4077878.1 GAF domain-containing protein [Hydrocarboniphaga sp.]